MHFKLLDSAYAKIFIAGVVAFLGIASGIYVGFAFSDNSSIGKKQFLSQKSSSDDFSMSLTPGDYFPGESFLDQSGAVHQFSEIFAGKNSILIFTLLGCGPCDKLLGGIRERMIPYLIPSAQVIFAVDSKQKETMQEYRDKLEGFILVAVDMDHWKNYYDMPIWPTMIGIDETVTILHIHFGFDNAIDIELAERFFED